MKIPQDLSTRLLYGEATLRIAKVRLKKYEEKVTEQNKTIASHVDVNFSNYTELLLVIINTMLEYSKFEQTYVTHFDEGITFFSHDRMVKLKHSRTDHTCVIRLTNDASPFNMVTDYAIGIIGCVKGYDACKLSELQSEVINSKYYVRGNERVTLAARIDEAPPLITFPDTLSDIDLFLGICKYIKTCLIEVFGPDE